MRKRGVGGREDEVLCLRTDSCVRHRALLPSTCFSPNHPANPLLPTRQPHTQAMLHKVALETLLAAAASAAATVTKASSAARAALEVCGGVLRDGGAPASLLVYLADASVRLEAAVEGALKELCARGDCGGGGESKPQRAPPTLASLQQRLDRSAAAARRFAEALAAIVCEVADSDSGCV